jgi:hypothetical protein
MFTFDRAALGKEQGSGNAGKAYFIDSLAQAALIPRRAIALLGTVQGDKWRRIDPPICVP